eukprot:CAMPEP_0175935692 /NCGR_PEP_ID=MMETSP0108-20121206/21187_1 /TAXON_ID=195067 ORGANISM="Goniomonas pacifica, Strain CCMP1869" /NCGR_SAMPLE_ID=MMETSP0108 /ASSEMBLY_ACC=CAM_ASM_000204 /LENGTH=102 /DNA_ID=CAMNT_0017259671 /DNA_START=136 /DNA_END=444 /DNA_ORIENTATION=+
MASPGGGGAAASAVATVLRSVGREIAVKPLAAPDLTAASPSDSATNADAEAMRRNGLVICGGGLGGGGGSSGSGFANTSGTVKENTAPPALRRRPQIAPRHA